MLRDAKIKKILGHLSLADHLDFFARAACVIGHTGLAFVGHGTHQHVTPTIFLTKRHLVADMLGFMLNGNVLLPIGLGMDTYRARTRNVTLSLKRANDPAPVFPHKLTKETWNFFRPVLQSWAQAQ